MNISIVARILAYLVLGLAIVGLLPLLFSLFGDRRGPWPWLAMIATALGVAALLLWQGRNARVKDLSIREGIAITSLVWIVASLIGAVGIRLATPEISYLMAWFEAMSGFTTTGSTIFGETIAISGLDRGVLVWRHLMQWLGGLGIVVISLSLLPLLTGGGGFSLYRAEMPGITNERLAPRIADTARWLVTFYLALTIAVTLALWATGASLFHSFCHALSTVATGGFSTFDNSIDGFASASAEWIIIIGMIGGALSFALLIAALRGHTERLWASTETRVFLALLTIAGALVCYDVATHNQWYSTSTHDLIRHSLFNVISTGTTTGFAVGYNASDGASWSAWPAGSHMVLILLMIVGGCTGGTAGGSKVIRWVVAWKALHSELRRFVEPARVTAVAVNGKPLDSQAVRQVGSFFFILFLCWAGGSLLIALAGQDLITSLGTALTAVTNNGPGLGATGVDGNFAAIGPLGHLTCIFLMLVGRLEFFGFIALCSSRHWHCYGSKKPDNQD
ncbi:MAG: TrkH family potassium uptake protein [Planctomycetota bacterium]|nr:MAG: TrkH family potassium uptake protein [Planctomycetota bacterium]